MGCGCRAGPDRTPPPEGRQDALLVGGAVGAHQDGEVRRRTRPMGPFRDKTSIDRILVAVLSHENLNQGMDTPFPLTHNS